MHCTAASAAVAFALVADDKMEEDSVSSEDSMNLIDHGAQPTSRPGTQGGGGGGIANLRVSGEEFLNSLKDALLEMDVDARSREEVHALALFLVAFLTEDRKQTLDGARLNQLTFTFRLESADRTRRSLFGLLHTGPNLTQVVRVDCGFLVPTDTFVAYLCAKTYHKRRGESSKRETTSVLFLPGSGREPALAGTRRPVWRRHDTLRANFLHFLVNMFARHVPGNLLYNVQTCEGSLDEGNDFFACVKFLQDNLLRNPMNLHGIYERIWENFQRLSREAEGLARVEELRLYCQPIICNNWSACVLRHNGSGRSIDKNTFIRVCHECML